MSTDGRQSGDPLGLDTAEAIEDFRQRAFDLGPGRELELAELAPVLATLEQADRVASELRTAVQGQLGQIVSRVIRENGSLTDSILSPVEAAREQAEQIAAELSRQVETAIQAATGRSLELAAGGGVNPTAVLQLAAGDPSGSENLTSTSGDLSGGQALTEATATASSSDTLPDGSSLPQQRIGFVDAFNQWNCCDPIQRQGDACQLIINGWIAEGFGTEADLVSEAGCLSPDPDPQPDPDPTPPPDPDPDPVPPPDPDPDPDPVPDPDLAPDSSPVPPPPANGGVFEVGLDSGSPGFFPTTCSLGWEGASQGGDFKPPISTEFLWQDIPKEARIQRTLTKQVREQSYQVYSSSDTNAVFVSERRPGQQNRSALGDLVWESDLPGQAFGVAKAHCERRAAASSSDVAEWGGQIFLDWGSEEICDLVAGAGLNPQGLPELTLSWIVGLSSQFGVPRTPDALKGLTFWGLPVGETIGNLLRFGLDSISVTLNTVFGDAECFGGEAAQIRVLRIIIGFLRKYVADNLEALSRPLDYLLNSKCPTILPSAVEALDAFLADAIDADLLKCWVEANGSLWGPFQKLIEGRRSKFSGFDLASLFRREAISDEFFRGEIRRLGFLREVDPQFYLKLTEQIPPTSDIVRMMVRDAADEGVVAKFGYDEGFGDKFSGDLERWAREQGVDPTYMRFLWRSHWDIPSTSQLFEMLHRLRPGRSGAADPVSREDVAEAVRINDMAPNWVERLIEISFNPLTRVDVRRAYDIGQLDENDVLQSNLDLGYSPDNAQRLTDFAVVEKRRRYRTHRWTKAYIAGAVSRTEAERYLQDEGASPADAQDATNHAFRDIRAQSQERCVRALRAQTLKSEIDPGTALGELTGLGLDVDHANELVKGWACERESRSRLPTVSQLCQFRRVGAVDDAEYVAGLRRLNYDNDDILRISEACNLTISRQLLREQRIADSAIRRAQNASQAAKRRADSREKRLLKCASDYSKKSGLDVEIAASEITTARRSIRTQLDLTLAESVDVAELACKAWVPGSGRSLLDEFTAFAASYKDLETTNGQTAS